MESIADAIRRRRLAAGLTQHQLADKAGVSRSWLAQIETDAIIDPSAEKLVSLAVALHLPVAAFFTTDQRQQLVVLDQISTARLDAARLLDTLSSLDPNLDSEIESVFLAQAMCLTDALEDVGVTIQQDEAHHILASMWHSIAQDPRVWLLGAYISRFVADDVKGLTAAPPESTPGSTPTTPNLAGNSGHAPSPSGLTRSTAAPMRKTAR